ncbi:hypothetical protein [Magnetospira thiophila]
MKIAPIFVLLLLVGCASPAEIQNMIISEKALIRAHPVPFKDSLIIALVDGGESTNPMWTSEVSNSGFRGALQGSLEKSSLLAPGLPESRFDLYATLNELNQPLFGLDLTVSSQVKYRVVERDSKKTWFDELVSAAYTATFSDSPLAVQRLRLANEGSIRENIKQFIQRLVESSSPVS